jgi:tRNA A-37 threonylcarbamoyl transferase component Bud32
MDRVSTPSGSQSSDGPTPWRSGGVLWEARPEWRDVVAAGGTSALPLERWLREGRAAVVKRGAGRVVYRVDLPHRSFFLKHLQIAGGLPALKQWFRPGACRREYERAQELARRGVPAVAPIALGERRRGARLIESFLVTEAVPQACSLDEYLATQLPRVAVAARSGVRRRLIEAAAQLCARAHAAGVFHDDLHGGNILLRIDTCRAAADAAPSMGAASPGTGIEPQLFLVDLPGVELSTSLDAARTCRSLAMLCAGFLDRTSNADRLRFWRTYCAHRTDLVVDDPQAFAAEIRTAALAHARRIAARRDKRAWADNRDFFRVTTADGAAHAVRDLPRSLVEQLLHEPNRLWQAHVDRPVKLSVGSLVVEAELPTLAGPRHVAVKRLRPKNWLKTVASWFRRGRAPEAWYRGHALLARGIPTARPLVVYEPRRNPGHHGFLVTEWLTDAEDLHLYAWDLAKRPAAERRRRIREVAEAAGKIIGRLHDQGFTHRDLKGNNLLVREMDGGVEMFLIDLDGLRQGSRPTQRACCKNLTRIALSAEMHPWVSRTDRLRFLRAYLRRYAADSAHDWKPWWRETARHVAAALQEFRAAGKVVT